jgi:NAD(P)-dependent dehydrogenase (short-subunit alcohol dehydrogenase family)
MPRLSGKRIVITGAVGGIGSATARACAAEGARLVLVDRDPELDHLAAELDAVALTADVADPDAPALALERLGGVDGLANIAGVHPTGTVLDALPHDWDRTLAVNLLAPAAWSRACIPHMRANGGGAIVNLCSVVAVAPSDAIVVYSVSKAALLALTRSVAVDFGRSGIRCNAISPGLIDTEMLAEAARVPARLDRLRAGVPAGRIGKPADVAACCVHLLSDEASYITGANVVIDGGQLVHL